MREFIAGEYYDFNKQESVEFNFVKNPGRSELQEYVDHVVNVLVTGEHYHVLMKDIISDFLLIYMFSDVDVQNILDATDNDMEQFVNSNTIASVIKDALGADLVDEISVAIDEGIAYKVGFYASPVNKELSKLLKAINTFSSTINMEEMNQFIKSVNQISDGVTADKIVDAYANSDKLQDMFKEADLHRENQNNAIIEILNENKKQGE